MAVTHDQNAKLIEDAFARKDLTTQDILNLTIARRLNNASENTFAQALGGGEVGSARRRGLLGL